MKTFLLCFIIIMAAPCAALYAASSDSLAYQLQRQKINGLLEQRSQKFSQYAQSLNTHTGIFGWQTKKDIRRSGEILMDIAQTDDVIFKELKVLLDYKTFQQTQVAEKSHNSEDLALNYMLTINKLRQQNQKLKLEQDKLNDEYGKKQTVHIIIIMILLGTLIFLFTRRRLSNNT